MRRPSTPTNTIALVLALIAVVVTTLPQASATDDDPVEEPVLSVDRDLYIVGGTDITPPGSTPWLAAILDGRVPDPYLAQFCTGTLVTPSQVLTAGHCVKDASGRPLIEDFEVAIGIIDLDEIGPADRRRATATTHPSFTGTAGVDLAILTLESPVVGVPTLPIRSSGPSIGDRIDAYGWGGTLPTGRNSNSYPDVAQQGSMTVTTDHGSTADCGFGPGEVDHSHQFCFDDPVQAACFGDSGGPAVLPGDNGPALVGVISQGPTICNQGSQQEIAERVIDSLAWIRSLAGECLWNPVSYGADYPGWTVPCWLPPASGATIPFVDVDFSLFYIDGVKWLWSNSITTGTGPSTFSPDARVIRGQLAAFLWRFAGQPAASGVPFADVVAPWQQDPVAWLDAWDITTGTSAATFSPDDQVTRGQLVTFLWRLVGAPVPVGPSGFPDVASGEFYSDAVAWAAVTGVTTGYPDGTFQPDRPVTRGEMATFLLRLAKLVESVAPADS